MRRFILPAAVQSNPNAEITSVENASISRSS